MPIEISQESNFLNKSDGSEDSEDSIFGPENDIMVSPTPEVEFQNLDPDRKQRPRNREMSAQERLVRLASAMQDEG